MPKRQPAPRVLHFSSADPGVPRLEVIRLKGQRLADLGLHGHRFFELILLERGSGVHRLGGRAIPAAVGDLFLIAPGEAHDASRIEGFHGWILVFELDALGLEGDEALGNLPNELLLLSFLRPQGFEAGHFRLEPDAVRSWSARLAMLETELREKRLGFAEAARSHLRGLLIDAARLAASQLEGVSKSSRPLLRRVFRVIEARYREPISLVDVAREVQRSSAYLTNLVRRETGRTVLEWIIERRLTEARRLLLETDERVEDISASIGYSDAAYFVRQFKRLNGATPQAWRRANRTSEPNLERD